MDLSLSPIFNLPFTLEHRPLLCNSRVSYIVVISDNCCQLGWRALSLHWTHHCGNYMRMVEKRLCHGDEEVNHVWAWAPQEKAMEKEAKHQLTISSTNWALLPTDLM
jgi:hypothetical protein